MKKILYFLCFIIFFIPICGEAIVSPTNEFYINDYANILSVETEEYILQRSLALHAVDGTQIVVVTVLNLEGMSLEKYANDLFNSFGIGDSEKDNGLLLLLALEEREFRVEVGDGLSGILPDGKTGRFQDNYIIPYLRENKWDEGIKNGYNAFYAEIVEQNNLEVDYNIPVSKEENDDSLNEFGTIILIFFVPALLGGIVGTFVNIRPRSGERGVYNKAKKIKIFIFILVVVILLMILFLYLKWIYLTNALFYFLLFFLIASVGGVDFLKMSTDGGHYHGSGSGRSSSGFSGGGGRSIGGGSSRRF